MAEAHALGITLIGIGDTNCDPEDAVIEANQGAEADGAEQEALAEESAASEAEQAEEGTL